MIKTSSNKDLRKLNTFGFKVSAARYIEYDKAEDLKEILWSELPQPVLSVGEGSNLLFTGNFPGTVLHSGIKGIEVVEDRSGGDDVFVRAGAGVKWDDLCDWVARKELWGTENLSAIPGTVGAAPVQNIGAYGVEAGDLIDNVECYDIQTGSYVTLKASECEFAYRDSYFKHNRGRYVVLYVTFHLYADFRPQLEYAHLKEEVERNAEMLNPTVDPYKVVYSTRFSPEIPITPLLVRQTVKIIREKKLPDPQKVGSAGSFFKNPVVPREFFLDLEGRIKAEKGSGHDVPHYDLPDGNVKIPAAWLIESCGLKGFVLRGKAAVWDKQPLVLVNADGNAAPQDVLELEELVRNKVRETFNIKLSPEVDHI